MKNVHVFAIVAGLALSTLCHAQLSSTIANATYDKFDDRTEVSTSESGVDNAIARKTVKQDLRFHVSYLCHGDTSHCRPDNVELLFASHSTYEHFQSTNLVLLYNGRRVRASKPRWSRGDDGAGHPIEHIAFDIPVEDFRKLALAETVEGKLGETTFKLSDANLSGMRALANEMNSSARGKGKED